jgi:hypothetical protein
MDVELPERRIRSIKDFFAHVATVSLGILLAFGFEGTREWWHTRNLVQEARTNIVSEIADNKRDLDKAMQWTRGGRQQLEQALQQVDRWLAKTGEAPANAADDSNALPNVSILFVEASRTTAEATGAFGHMKYLEVKRYAEVYNLQREFQSRVARFHDHMSTIVPRKLSQLTPAELQDRRQRLLVGLQYLNDAEGMGQTLSDGYRSVGK